jgi:hypothetical protein
MDTKELINLLTDGSDLSELVLSMAHEHAMLREEYAVIDRMLDDATTALQQEKRASAAARLGSEERAEEIKALRLEISSLERANGRLPHLLKCESALSKALRRVSENCPLEFLPEGIKETLENAVASPNKSPLLREAEEDLELMLGVGGKEVRILIRDAYRELSGGVPAPEWDAIPF